MMKELRRPTPETLMLQRELEKEKENLRQEQTLANAVKQQLEKRLQEEVSVAVEVGTQFSVAGLAKIYITRILSG
jgi:hypothetical protein